MKGLFTLLSLALISAPAFSVTVSFEDLPSENFFNDTGANVASFYAGLTFGPGVTGLSVTRFGGYSDAAFPPHSGDVVVWSAFDFDTTIAFATPQAVVGLWYTSFDFLTLTAYDIGNSPLGSVVGNPNTDGFVGVSNFLSVSFPGISSVVISGLPSAFVFDDLTFSTTAAVPEPSSAILFGTAIAVLVLRRRFLQR
ncbi:MAG: PEP-CTERM sorting domain-containing protein [Bryobacteraceae bacterium]